VETRLVEERLATRLGVSHTPVREALVRLLADGLQGIDVISQHQAARPPLFRRPRRRQVCGWLPLRRPGTGPRRLAHRYD